MLRKIFLSLILVTFLMGWGARAEAAVSAPVIGEIDRLTIDTADPWSGGRMQVGGQWVIIPKNLLMDLPANRVTLRQLFDQAPAACVTAGETGLAKADTCNITGAGGFATIAANRTNNGNVIAGDVFIQKGIEFVAGVITFINYTDGYFMLNGDATGTIGTMVRLNDPGSRHTIQQGLGCPAGAPPLLDNCSPDPRFTLDGDNYTNRFSTGYPFCIPSTVARPFPGPSLGLLDTFAQAAADGTLDVACPTANRTLSPVDDSRRFAPILLGDFVTAEGNFETVNGVRFLSSHSTAINGALATKGDLNQPDYLFLDEAEIDAAGFNNARVRGLFIGFSTFNTDVRFWTRHWDRATNAVNEFPLGSIAGCDAVGGGAGTCSSQGLVGGGGGNIFKLRYDVDFLDLTAIAKRPEFYPCKVLAADVDFNPLNICPAGGNTIAENFAILSPTPHEIVVKTRRKTDSLKPGGTALITVDINGNEATNGEYIFPFGVGLGGIGFPEFVEINLGGLNTPYLFTGLPWNLDRRLSPGGCDPVAGCGTGPFALDPFPFEGINPTTSETTLPVGSYNDPNFTARSLGNVRNRILSFVSGNNFDGDNSVLAWPPADPALIPLTPIIPVQICAALPGPPAINSTPVATGAVGVGYVYDVNAADAPTDVLTYSLDVFPAGMAIDPPTGLITWLPGAVSVVNVTVRVTDQTALFATQSFNISVLGAPVNTPPAITSAPVTTGTAGQPYSYQVVATDTPGDVLTFSLTTAPAGMAISAAGLITWTPTAGQVGPNNATVQVTDQGGLFAQQPLTVTVATGPPVAVNDIATTPMNTPVAIGVGSNDTGVITPGTVAITGGPVAGTCAPFGGGVTYTPNVNFTGTDNFSYTVAGPGGISNSASVSVTVTPAITTEVITITRAVFFPNNARTAGRWVIVGRTNVVAPNNITAHLGTATGPVIGRIAVGPNGGFRIEVLGSRLVPLPGGTITVQSRGGATATAVVP